MRIVGHGVDIVPVTRIERLLRDHADRFLQRVYTPDEVADLLGTRRCAQRLASRFAAKEAAVKALGTGFTSGIAMRDISVVSHPGGRPGLLVVGRAAEIAEALGITAWHLSLSDCDQYAVASVIAVADALPGR